MPARESAFAFCQASQTLSFTKVDRDHLLAGRLIQAGLLRSHSVIAKSPLAVAGGVGCQAWPDECSKTAPLADE